MKEEKVVIKYKKVTRTKAPTVLQLLNMSSNLNKNFNNAHSSIEVVGQTFSSGTHEAKYQSWYIIYIASKFCKFFKSWKECQDAYFLLMEEK
jgi:hypothetical protein